MTKPTTEHQKPRSARTWIGGGQGHLPLAEARLWALEQVSLAEEKRDACKAEATRAAAEEKRATDEKDQAFAALRAANAALQRAREDLAYKVGDTDG